METCPHGARIVLVDGKPPVFLDECSACAELLSELGFAGDSVVYRAPVSAA